MRRSPPCWLPRPAVPLLSSDSSLAWRLPRLHPTQRCSRLRPIHRRVGFCKPRTQARVAAKMAVVEAMGAAEVRVAAAVATVLGEDSARKIGSSGICSGCNARLQTREYTKARTWQSLSRPPASSRRMAAEEEAAAVWAASVLCLRRPYRPCICKTARQGHAQQ